MQDCWASILVATALLVLSIGLFSLCRAGARYLDRAKAPESIDLGMRFSTLDKSFWLGIQGSKETPDSKKTIPTPNDDGPLCQ